MRLPIATLLTALFVVLTPCSAFAVYLSPDGTGQALIFPYYTAQSVGGDSLNTYISVVNHSSDAKAIRVRFREGRNSREVAAFNLFLSPSDTWTGAVVPSSTNAGAQLISADRSCVSPQQPLVGGVSSIAFSQGAYVGDGLGSGLDRTREGWIEVLEMATVTGVTAGYVAHDSSGLPTNCDGVQGNAALEVAAPSGGLSGTLTLINVANGVEFSTNAEALAGLSSRSFFRPADDSYPNFNAAEIDPVSVVTANGFIFRSEWAQSVDAVSAVFMRTSWYGEFVLDAVTNSKTDVVMTFPTRQFYVGINPTPAPFSESCSTPPDTLSGESIFLRYFGREESGATYMGGRIVIACAGSEVFDVRNKPPVASASTGVLGSMNLAMTTVNVPSSISNGWIAISLPVARTLTSLPTSTRTNIVTGQSASGSHIFAGFARGRIHGSNFRKRHADMRRGPGLPGKLRRGVPLQIFTNDHPGILRRRSSSFTFHASIGSWRAGPHLTQEPLHLLEADRSRMPRVDGIEVPVDEAQPRRARFRARE